MKQLMELFFIFFRIGGFTFGGGYAMLPLIQKEIVEQRGWATNEEVLDYYAIGQVTPGIIAVNTATFIGYKLRGVIGGIVATCGMVFPSIIIITIIAVFFENFAKYEVVQHAFGGIRIVVVALIAHTVYKMVKQSAKDKMTLAIAIVGFCIVAFLPVSPMWVIIAAAMTGIVVDRKGGIKV